MLLDNVFVFLGGTWTAAALFAVLAVVGIPAMGAVACPFGALSRYQPRGR